MVIREKSNLCKKKTRIKRSSINQKREALEDEEEKGEK